MLNITKLNYTRARRAVNIPQRREIMKTVPFCYNIVKFPQQRTTRRGNAA